MLLEAQISQRLGQPAIKNREIRLQRAIPSREPGKDLEQRFAQKDGTGKNLVRLARLLFGATSQLTDFLGAENLCLIRPGE